MQQLIKWDVQRSTQNKWLMGVCAGVARHYGWQPKYVRLATAIFAVAIPGVSVLPCVAIYLTLGVLLPKSREF